MMTPKPVRRRHTTRRSSSAHAPSRRSSTPTPSQTPIRNSSRSTTKSASPSSSSKKTTKSISSSPESSTSAKSLSISPVAIASNGGVNGTLRKRTSKTETKGSTPRNRLRFRSSSVKLSKGRQKLGDDDIKEEDHSDKEQTQLPRRTRSKHRSRSRAKSTDFVEVIGEKVHTDGLFQRASNAASSAAHSVMAGINDTRARTAEFISDTENSVSDRIAHAVDTMRGFMPRSEDEIYSWQAYEKCVSTFHEVESRLTLFYHELEAWQRDNVYIPTGYRKITNSYIGCIKTLAHANNETVNILSHLFGAILFAWLLYFSFKYCNISQYPYMRWSDYVVISTFMVCAITCLFVSAFFHLVVCHSRMVSNYWNRADYAGIVLLIVGSFIPTLYYAFYCHTNLMIFYIGSIILLGLITLSFCILERFATPKYRRTRTLMFMALGLFGVVPVLHSCMIYGFKFHFTRLNLLHLISMGFQYILGALIYMFRVPERWKPGFFDIVGHSHQIFHFLVVAAALTHYYGIINALDFIHCANPLCEHEPRDLIERFSTIA